MATNHRPIYEMIDQERERQKQQWGKEHGWGFGDCSSPAVDPAVKVAVLTEEIGEVARAVLERDGKQLVVELVQVAAVALAWLELLREERKSDASI